ncbi:CRISPR-associated protein Cas5 [Paenibacillus doosanensis]|uniref:CRISPR-associated protein Cas5 n=1 Tax=Paenibacillus doosanensis TaxID=1229154 RepID=UPI00217FBE3D|nr:CRISPR-associated protein Cas5 [Paenibacillus doosanensis]MCS7464200.1 CRISPR-associated protein Cas5 [Paenibacillus doosanensis]
MIEKLYPVSFEIAGPAAMFARPDTGSSPISYPAPTKSALKSMTECVALSKTAYFEPQRVEICSPIVFRKYSTNYGGPLRKSGTVNFQLFATILENVCYKVHGMILSYTPPQSFRNPQHQLQEVLLRRLSMGQFHSTPFLGWKEFVPTYFGPIRDTTVIDQSIHLVIPSMLATMYSRPTDGAVSPRFMQDVKIEHGVMFYAE